MSFILDDMVLTAESIHARFCTNGAPKARTINGRHYWEVPLSLIVPGVLNGSQGSLYYPPAECCRNIDAWNGMPLTYYHPLDGGQHVSARDPDALDRHGIGFVARAKFSGNKLRASGFFDIEQVKNADKRFGGGLYDKLRTGQPVELSTGLFTDNHPADPGATFNGRPYQFIAKNYKPDHVAVLPDQVGACSLKDGCGVGVANCAGGGKGGCDDGG